MENTKDFMIRLGSVRDVEEFVNLSTAQLYSIYLDDGAHRVNGKSFMEMFCLVLTRPLRVSLECSEEQARHFFDQTMRYHIE